MNLLTSLLVLAPIGLQAGPATQVSYSDLLQEFRDFRQLAAMPAAGVDNLFFHNQENPQKLESQGEDLFSVAEISKPGAITRMWFGNQVGDLLFFADGESEPSLRVSVASLFDGSLEGFQPPLSAAQGEGATCYVPLPFDKSLSIAATNKDLSYSIQVRTYPIGTRLPTLGLKLLSEQLDELKFVNSLLAKRQFANYPRKFTNQMGRYRPNMEQHSNINGSGAVRSVEVVFPDGDKIKDLGSVLRGLRVKVLVDKEKEAQLDLPFGAFFGVGIDSEDANSWLTKVEHLIDGSLVFTNFMPMPFANGMRFQIINESRRKVFLRTRVIYEEGDAGPFRIHGAWNQQKDVAIRPAIDWNWLKAEGPGRLLYAGLDIRNLSQSWWGGGPVSLQVDGEERASVVAGDLDSFFGFNRQNANPYVTPLLARPRVDGPGFYGWNTHARYFFGDQYLFNESIELGFAIKPMEGESVDIATTAIWYAPLNAGHEMPALPDPDAREPRLVPEPTLENSPG